MNYHILSNPPHNSRTNPTALVSSLPFTHKPTNSQYGLINGSFSEQTLSIKDICAALESGKAIVGSQFVDSERKNDKWTNTNCIILDFDDHKEKGCWTIDEFMDTAARHNLLPNIVQKSWSYTEDKQKFHAFYFLDAPIIDSRVHTMVYRMMSYVFEGRIDTSTFDPARLINGSFKGSILKPVNEGTRLSFMNVLDACDSHIRHIGGANHSRKLSAFCASMDLSFHDTPIIYNRHVAGNHPILVHEHEYRLITRCKPCIQTSTNVPAKKVYEKKTPHNQNYTETFTKSKQEELANKCQLVRDFINGTRCSYLERLGILYNVGQYRNAATVISSIYEAHAAIYTDANGYFGYGSARKTSAQRLQQSLSALEYWRREYNAPMTCEKIGCKYLQSCQRKGKCLIHQLDNQHSHKTTKIEDIQMEHSSLEQTRTTLEQVSILAYTDPQKDKIHVIRCDTGVGKTEVIINRLPIYDGGVYVGFPNHKLKDEVYSRLSTEQREKVFYWPQRPHLTEEYENEIKHLEECSLSGVITILNKFIENEYKTVSLELIEAVQDYIDASVEVQKTRRTIFGTHDKSFLLHNPNIKAHILDEDCMDNIIKTGALKSNDVYLLDAEICSNPKYATLKTLVANLINLKVDEVLDMKSIPNYAKSLLVDACITLSTKVSSPLIKINTASHIMRTRQDLIYVEKRDLKKDVKYLIFSATANEDIYRKLFGSRLEYHGLTNTELRGNVYFHSEKTYSRESMKNMYTKGTLADYVINESTKNDIDCIITYKEYVDPSTNCFKGTEIPVACYFGNLEGYNQYGGKNLAIYGVPQKPQEVYRLMSLCLGNNVDMSRVKKQSVLRNGYRFQVYTIDDPLYQTVQMHCIESELIQAIGRARLVNNDCDVHLYGNVPPMGNLKEVA